MRVLYIEGVAIHGGPEPWKRRTTGMEKGMEESYVEDLASHDGPVHALATREGAAKRWMRGARRPGYSAPKWGRSGCRRGHGTRKAIPLAAFGEPSGDPAGSKILCMRVISSC